MGGPASQWKVEIAAEAAALGVSAALVSVAAPFVVSGSCDGRAFYLRERHGTYRVTVASEDDPDLDLWISGSSAPSIDVAGGAERELCDADGARSVVVALRVAVSAVRTALLRARCPHHGETGPYCPTCGVRRTEADRWRPPPPGRG